MFFCTSRSTKFPQKPPDNGDLTKTITHKSIPTLQAHWSMFSAIDMICMDLYCCIKTFSTWPGLAKYESLELCHHLRLNYNFTICFLFSIIFYKYQNRNCRTFYIWINRIVLYICEYNGPFLVAQNVPVKPWRVTCSFYNNCTKATLNLGRNICDFYDLSLANFVRSQTPMTLFVNLIQSLVYTGMKFFVLSRKISPLFMFNS